MQRLIKKKNDLISLSTGVTDLELEEFEMRIRKEVIEEAEKAKAIALQFLKDSDHVSPAATVRAASTGRGASSSSNT